ncbi:UDP-glucuronosyltransferase 2A3-like [Ptychodera flava]|uniref:UDP-glucuronosyltransferase 2A3-like n=1 Tax=Ptychodera flava TaxID=63121 RepID=UPI00396A2822
MFGLYFLFLMLVTDSRGSKILVLSGIHTGSHFIYFSKLGEHLANAGHEVTLLLGHYNDLNKITQVENLLKFETYKTVIDETLFEKMDKDYCKKAVSGEASLADWVAKFSKTLVDDCSLILENDELFKNFRKANFDIVVFNAFTPCGALIAQKLSLPYVVFSTRRPESPAHTFHTRIPSPISYVPTAMSRLTTKMTFVERLQNMATYVIGLYYLDFVILKPYQMLKTQHNIKPESPMYNFYADSEIVLFGVDWASDIPRPLMPNTVFIGCMLCQEPKALSNEWQEFVNSADDGIVVFSFGSYVTLGIAIEKAETIAAALARLPQKVAMRYKGNPLKNLGPNTKLAKWIPQNDLLGNPRTKAFITHAGMKGVAEAIFHGVPIVGIPLWSDQFDNMARMTEKGMAVTLAMATLTSDELYEAVTDVIEDPSYKENAARLSRIQRDVPMSTGEAAVFWIEHVINHGGQHLRAEALNLNIIQYFSLDVIAFLFVILILFVFLFVKAMSFFCRLLCKKTGKEKVN